MLIQFVPFDAQHYLMNLRLNASGALVSDRMGDQYSLILRLPYQQQLSAITPQVFRELLQNYAPQLIAHQNSFIQVGNNADMGLFLRTAVITGFQVVGAQNKASTYAMFACELRMQGSEQLLMIYASPQGLFAAGNTCEVPAVVQVRVSKQMKKKAFGGEKFTGYYIAEFTGCNELDNAKIWYNLPDSKINFPINEEMLKKRVVYIKSEYPPEFKSVGGVRVDVFG